MNRSGYQLKLSLFLSTGWGPLQLCRGFRRVVCRKKGDGGCKKEGSKNREQFFHLAWGKEVSGLKAKYR